MHRQRMKRLVAFVLGLCLIFGLTPNMQVKVAAKEKKLTLKVFGVNSGEERTFTTEKQPYSDQAVIEVTGDNDGTNITIGFDKLKKSFEEVYIGTTLDMEKAVIKLENEEKKFDSNSKNVSFLSAKADQVKLVVPAEQGTTVKFVLGEADKIYSEVKTGADLENKLQAFLATPEATAELEKNEVTKWTYEKKKDDPSDLLNKENKLGSNQLPQVTYLVVNAATNPLATLTIKGMKAPDGSDISEQKLTKNKIKEIDQKYKVGSYFYIANEGAKKYKYIFKGWNDKDGNLISESLQKYFESMTEPQILTAVFGKGNEMVGVKVSALKLDSDTEYSATGQDVTLEAKEYTFEELGKVLKQEAGISDPIGGKLTQIFVTHAGKTENETVDEKYTPQAGDLFTLKWQKQEEKDKEDLVWFDATPSTIRSEIDDERKEKKKAVFDTKVSRKVTISTGKNRKATITDIPIPERYFNETLNTMMEFDYWTDIDMRKYWKNDPLLENSAEKQNLHYLDLTLPENVSTHVNNEEKPFYALYKPMAKVEVNFYYTGDPGITIYTGKDYVLRRPVIVYFSQGTPITLEALGNALDGKLGKDNTIQSIKYLDPESGVDKVFNLLPELATLNGNPMNILSEEGSTYDSNVVNYHKNRMDIVKLYYSYNQNAVTVTFDIQVPDPLVAAKVGTPRPKVTEKGMYINAPTDWQPARRRGYTFQGWYPTQEDAAALTNEISFPYMVQENITLYAGWEGNKVYIIYRYNNGMGTEYKLARNGELIPEPSFPVPYWPGMKFSGWYMTLGPEKGIGIDNAGPKEAEEKKEEDKANAQKQWPLKGFRLPIDDPYLGQGNTTPGYITNTVVNGPMLVDAMWTPLVTTSSLTKPDQAGAPQVAANQVGTNPVNAADLPEAGEHNYSFVVGGFLALAAGIFLLKRKAF